MKITLKHVLVMMLLMPRALVWGASDKPTWGNGLETDNATQLKVLIEEMSEAGRKIGLTRERIEARVNQSLRKAGITPVPAEPNDAFGASVVYVNVTVVNSGSFTIAIFLQRPVFYRKGDEWFVNLGTTWRSSGTGIAHGADYVLDLIAQDVEVFCNEFLKANGK